MVFLMVAFMCLPGSWSILYTGTSFYYFPSASITLKGDAGEYIKIIGRFIHKRNLKYPGKPS
ncbi:hypothetical protein SeW_A4760 [Salmonella enterica subsp. enterica serovar Weltevreden str. HI_N05-537]|nr:hypothetical protein SeW_A4760 [Salmonella enterica subsp. enterica serovar Weltevreden str. HI_N05-537]